MSRDLDFEARVATRVRSRGVEAKQKLALIRAEAAQIRLLFTDRLLLRHLLILGATGSGKTNHAFYAIQQSIAHWPKSCIIIDVKREYRKLKGVVREDLQILAVGDEPRVSFNPLIPPPGVENDLWDRAFIDVFTRAYGLSEPSRRILFDCLWELREQSKGSPTLRELERAVAEFEAGSTKEQASKRSLESRLHIINMGTVGRSLNSEQALDFDAMEEKVTVYEIGQVDSLRDQRFLAEVMLAQLWHHDKARVTAEEEAEEKLQRLIVVEEAHRYLSEERPPQQRGDRTLLELAIAEARRYGWGFIIVDQMPLLLSRYVWDNCGTVIAHRLTNLDSYEAVKSALGGDPFLNERDAKGDPLALRLPEDLALFRRYVEPDSSAAGTGFVMVPRVRAMQQGEGEPR
jgi:hypothetical protein